MASSAIKGSYGIIQIATNAIGELISGKITIGNKTIDVSNYDEDWDEFIKGKGNWSITGRANFVVSGTAQAAIETNILDPTSTYLAVRFLINAAGDDYYSGNAHPTQWDVDGSNTTQLVVDFTLQGTGAIAREA